MRHWCCSCCGHWGPHWPTTHPSCHSACYHGKSAVIGALAARHAPESIKKTAISKNDDANRHNAELMLNKYARTQILRVNDQHHVLGCPDKPARSYHCGFSSVSSPTRRASRWMNHGPMERRAIAASGFGARRAGIVRALAQPDQAARLSLLPLYQTDPRCIPLDKEQLSRGMEPVLSGPQPSRDRPGAAPCPAFAPPRVLVTGDFCQGPCVLGQKAIVWHAPWLVTGGTACSGPSEHSVRLPPQGRNRSSRALPKGRAYSVAVQCPAFSGHPRPARAPHTSAIPSGSRGIEVVGRR